MRTSHDIYIASPLPGSPKRKRPRRKTKELAAPFQSTTRHDDTDDDTTEDETSSKAGSTPSKDQVVQKQPALDTFRVLDLPRELRCMVWEYVVLHDNVTNLDNHPALQKFAEENPSCAVRRYIPGYYRPTALLTRHHEILRGRYSQVYLINRLPSLFLVNKETATEAREVAFRHVVLEIDRDICRQIFNKSYRNPQVPMLRNLRNLYLSAVAKVPRLPTWTAPMPFGTGWPMIEFDHRSTPLFHLSIAADGAHLTLKSQRDFIPRDRSQLDSAVALWRSMLPTNHRFNSIDLLALANVMAEIQVAIGVDGWTLRIDEQDKAKHKEQADATHAHERKTGERDFAGGWMKIEPEFRVTIVKVTAPCLQATGSPLDPIVI